MKELATQSGALRLLRDSLGRNFGDDGVAQTLPTLQVSFASPRVIIVRCAREHSQQVWAALTFLTTCDSRTVLYRVVRVSSKLELCVRKALQLYRNRREVPHAHLKVVEDEERALKALC